MTDTPSFRPYKNRKGPELFKVRSAYRNQAGCSACGKLIDKGMSYWWWRIRGTTTHHIKYTRCRDNECLPNNEELSHPAFYSELHTIRRKLKKGDFHAALDLLGSLRLDLESKLNNIPHQFQYGPSARLLTEEIAIVDRWMEFLTDTPTTEEAIEFTAIDKHLINV